MKLAFCSLCSLLAVFGHGQGVPQNAPAQPNANPQQAALAEPVKPEERCLVEGNVYSTSGEPLKKATLTMRSANPTPGSSTVTYVGVSDASGHFQIQDVEPGKFRLWVERTGFVGAQYGAKTPSVAGTILALQKSQKLKDIDFKLIPQGVITGRVLDEDGDPVQNVQIQTMRSMYLRGKKQWMPAGYSSTNDLGEYRIFGIAPGRYLLSAVYRPMMYSMESTQGGPEEGYAPTYYPNAAAAEMAAPIEVTAGAQLRGMDIRLQKTKTVQIRGRVMGFGSMAQSIMIRCRRRNRTPAILPVLPTAATGIGGDAVSTL
jgi:protocatechuate 3,4-dioxygenase beta subunit